MLLSYPTRFLPLVDRALQLFQQRMIDCPSNTLLVHGDSERGVRAEWTFKANVHARLHELPLVEGRFWKRSLSALHASDVSHIVSLHGTVIRTGAVRMVESSREYECRKCTHRFLVWSDLDQGHSLTVPTSCPAPGRKSCKSSQFDLVEGSAIVRDFQRIKLQDAVMKLALGTLPRSIYCTLHDDLVDRCHAGDEVEIVGVVRRNWAPLQKEADATCELYIDACHVHIKHDRVALASAAVGSVAHDEHRHLFQQTWQHAALSSRELFTRDLIVASFCPKLYGLFMVKLAVVLTIIGGVQHVRSHKDKPNMRRHTGQGKGRSSLSLRLLLFLRDRPLRVAAVFEVNVICC